MPVMLPFGTDHGGVAFARTVLRNSLGAISPALGARAIISPAAGSAVLYGG